MLTQEADDRLVAAHPVRQLEDIVAFVVEDQVLHSRTQPAKLADEVA